MGKSCFRIIIALTGMLCLFLSLCGMVFPATENLPANLEKLNWRKEDSDIDWMHFPRVPLSFAINVDGYWAVAYQENIHNHIVLVAPDHTLEQYSFEAEGSWAMDITGRELLIYLSRANTYFAVDLQTGQWEERRCDGLKNAPSTWELRQRRTVQQGPYTLIAVTGWNHYRLELNGMAVLQASPVALLLQWLPYSVPLWMLFLLIYLVRKNLKHRKEKHHTPSGAGCLGDPCGQSPPL